ncbi:MAG: hypothetical protein AAF526_06200 [Pseudomonadota bacterium]
MAHVSQTPQTGLIELAGAILGAFAALPNAFAATDEYRRLDAMTDDQLARLGLKRHELARIVYDHHFR